jgi:hypothetical protein
VVFPGQTHPRGLERSTVAAVNSETRETIHTNIPLLPSHDVGSGNYSGWRHHCSGNQWCIFHDHVRKKEVRRYVGRELAIVTVCVTCLLSFFAISLMDDRLRL